MSTAVATDESWTPGRRPRRDPTARNGNGSSGSRVAVTLGVSAGVPRPHPDLHARASRLRDRRSRHPPRDGPEPGRARDVGSQPGVYEPASSSPAVDADAGRGHQGRVTGGVGGAVGRQPGRGRMDPLDLREPSALHDARPRSLGQLGVRPPAPAVRAVPPRARVHGDGAHAPRGDRAAGAGAPDACSSGARRPAGSRSRTSRCSRSVRASGSRRCSSPPDAEWRCCSRLRRGSAARRSPRRWSLKRRVRERRRHRPGGRDPRPHHRRDQQGVPPRLLPQLRGRQDRARARTRACCPAGTRFSSASTRTRCSASSSYWRSCT